MVQHSLIHLISARLPVKKPGFTRHLHSPITHSHNHPIVAWGDEGSLNAPPGRRQMMGFIAFTPTYAGWLERYSANQSLGSYQLAILEPPAAGPARIARFTIKHTTAKATRTLKFEANQLPVSTRVQP
jgi:hypothetical protein